MTIPLAHVAPDGMPLAPDVAGVVLAVGLVVLLVVAYDYYRHQFDGGS